MNTRILLTLSALAGFSVAAHATELFAFGGFEFTETATSLSAFSNTVTVPTGETATFKPTGVTYDNIQFTMTPVDLSGYPGAGIYTFAAAPTISITGTASGSSTRLNLITITSNFGEYSKASPHKLGADNTNSDPMLFDNIQYTSDLFTQNDLSGNNYQFGLSAVPSYTAGEVTILGNVVPNPVPEPTTLAALGLGGFAVLRRRRRA